MSWAWCKTTSSSKVQMCKPFSWRQIRCQFVYNLQKKLKYFREIIPQNIKWLFKKYPVLFCQIVQIFKSYFKKALNPLYCSFSFLTCIFACMKKCCVFEHLIKTLFYTRPMTKVILEAICWTHFFVMGNLQFTSGL